MNNLFNSKKLYVVPFIVAVIFSGCGGMDKVKPSADSLLATETINLINTIKAAYQGKERDVLQNYLAPEIAESTLKELSFDKAELSFTPQMVRIEASTIMVNTIWHGTWIIKGSSIKNRGVAVFVFVGYDSTLREGTPVKLIRIDGDNPFQTPD